MILQILGILLIALGIWILFTWDRGIDNKDLLIVILLGIIFVFLGVKILFGPIDTSVVIRRLIGVALAFGGVFFIIGFPDVNPDYQSTGMSWFGTFLGIVLLVAALYLLVV